MTWFRHRLSYYAAKQYRSSSAKCVYTIKSQTNDLEIETAIITAKSQISVLQTHRNELHVYFRKESRIIDQQGTGITRCVSVASEIELDEIIHCDRQSLKCDIETSTYIRAYPVYRTTYPRDTY